MAAEASVPRVDGDVTRRSNASRSAAPPSTTAVTITNDSAVPAVEQRSGGRARRRRRSPAHTPTPARIEVGCGSGRRRQQPAEQRADEERRGDDRAPRRRHHRRASGVPTTANSSTAATSASERRDGQPAGGDPRTQRYLHSCHGPPARALRAPDPAARAGAGRAAPGDVGRGAAARRRRFPGDAATRPGPSAVGFFSCSKSTNEMNYIAQKFARAVIGTNNIDSCNRT